MEEQRTGLRLQPVSITVSSTKIATDFPDSSPSVLGVFIPFKLMFPDDNGPFSIPVVEVSISADLQPEAEYQIGRAVQALR